MKVSQKYPKPSEFNQKSKQPGAPMFNPAYTWALAQRTAPKKAVHSHKNDKSETVNGQIGVSVVASEFSTNTTQNHHKSSTTYLPSLWHKQTPNGRAPTAKRASKKWK
jgi:hypothetical protein